MGTQWKDGYSAEVNIFLVIGDEALDVAQVGPEFLILADPRDIEQCRAEIVVEVDGRKTRYPVVLYDGASVEYSTVKYAGIDRNRVSFAKEALVANRQRTLPSFE